MVNTVGGRGQFRGAGGSRTPSARATCRGPTGAGRDYGTAARGAAWDLQFAHFHAGPDCISLLDWREMFRGVRRRQVGGVARQRVIEAFDQRWSAGLSAQRQPTLQPPSTTSFWPVTYDERSEAR